MYTLLLQSVPPNAFVEEAQPVGAQGSSAGIGLYVPAPHATHTADVSPSPELYEPAEQVVNRQVLAPVVATYLAWVHAAHEERPALDPNVPAAQGVHALDEPAE
jgi:hypothetical protein